MDISLFRSIANQYQELRGIHTIATMNVIGDLLEDQLLNHKLPVDLFAGFQRFSHFLEHLRRYSYLGEVCRRVFVFGVPDVHPPEIPGIEFIGLEPNSALSRERFWLVDTPDFWTAVLTQAVEGQERNSSNQSFDGLWSYDEEVVARVSLLMSQVMGTFYQPIRTRNYVQQSAHIAEINGRLLGRLKESELTSHRRWVQLSTLHKFATALSQHQPLPCILRDAVQILFTNFGAADAVIALNLNNDNFMVVSAAGNISTNKPIVGISDGASGKAIGEGRLIYVEDVRQNGLMEPLMPTAQTLMAAPLQGRRRVYGVVTVGGREPKQWNEEDGQTVMAIAKMLAVLIEQKTQLSGDVVLQLRRAKHLEQTISKLRQPIARLRDLQQKLREEVHLLPIQRELMAQVEALFSDVAKMIGVPLIPTHSHESQLFSPSKAAAKSDPKVRASTAGTSAVVTPRLSAHPPHNFDNGEL